MNVPFMRICSYLYVHIKFQLKTHKWYVLYRIFLTVLAALEIKLNQSARILLSKQKRIPTNSVLFYITVKEYYHLFGSKISENVGTNKSGALSYRSNRRETIISDMYLQGHLLIAYNNYYTITALKPHYD